MICIIGAMPEEVNALLDNMSEIKEQNEEYAFGVLAGKDVVVCTSGVGKVNAAYMTTKTLIKYEPEMVINIGSAGGLLKGQEVGDVVIADVLQYHDFDIGEETISDKRYIFYSNKTLNDKLEETLKTLNTRYHKGLMVSGDQFIINTTDAFRNIQNKFPSAHCVEMEATAIAHACFRHNTAFVVMRSLSDIAFDNDDILEFDKYLPIAAKNSAAICKAFIGSL